MRRYFLRSICLGKAIAGSESPQRSAAESREIRCRCRAERSQSLPRGRLAGCSLVAEPSVVLMAMVPIRVVRPSVGFQGRTPRVVYDGRVRGS